MAPGSVAITDESGRELPPGQDGIIWFTRPANKFSYHNDPEKSASMFNDRGWARMGDLGHLDGDGYLFITGRSDHTIISGGVNIYPREIEDLLIAHPAVDDVAVIGVPDDEYGESVRPSSPSATATPAAPRSSGTSSTGPGRASRTTSAPGRSPSSTRCRARWPAR